MKNKSLVKNTNDGFFFAILAPLREVYYKKGR